jgi:rhamnogalacturonyl hydrolase YesR
MAQTTAIEAGDGILDDVIRSVLALDGWVERNGWAGYDPYDLRGHPFFLRLAALKNRNIALRLVVDGVMQMTDLSPSLLRKIFRIRQAVNAKGMGLFAAAYLDLHQRLGEDGYLKKALACLDWLEKNRAAGYAGDCWGYPFDWQSAVFTPAGVPSAVVSSICGDAFWSFYRFTGEKRYLAACESICDFLVNSLNIDLVSEDRLCFSYTPRDHSHVHNANLFAAEFLVRVGKELKREDFYQQGMKAMDFTIADQRADGAFYYRAPADRAAYNLPASSLGHIDHYHTGFVLRSLYSIYKITGEKRAFKALAKGYRFYRDNLFEDGTVPRAFAHSLYPVNIHGCAEAVLCMSILSDLFPDALGYAARAFRWTRANMQAADGHFYYTKSKFELKAYSFNRALKIPYLKFGQTSKIPYIRWGQAWMIRAMASLSCRV